MSAAPADTGGLGVSWDARSAVSRSLGRFGLGGSGLLLGSARSDCRPHRVQRVALSGGRSLKEHLDEDGQVDFNADDPPYRGIASEPVGIVHVLVAGEAPEHRLAKLGDQAVATVSPGAGVGENLGRHLRQAQGIVEFAEREARPPSRSSSTDWYSFV